MIGLEIIRPDYLAYSGLEVCTSSERVKVMIAHIFTNGLKMSIWCLYC